MNRFRLLWLVAAICCVLGACATQEPAHVTISQLVRGERPAVGADDGIPGFPRGSVALRATVTDVRSTPALLVELSDPHQEEHVWVSGFGEQPGRGEEVWTAILGPPAANDLVGVTYPSAGLLPEPESVTRVTPRGALAVLLGAVAVVALLSLLVAAAVTRRRQVRRCPGCAGAVDASWVTCPRCGHSLVAPSPPPGELVLPPPSPPPIPDSMPAPVRPPAAPTVLIRGDLEA
ncbi:MAG: hypothetical protein QOG43_2931 [Actinomycetota bacterium]|nr:hypothetical protein [Actinomycetota bacterium]